MNKELFDKTPKEVIDEAKKFVVANFKHETDMEQLVCYKHIETFVTGYHYAMSQISKQTEDELK